MTECDLDAKEYGAGLNNCMRTFASRDFHRKVMDDVASAVKVDSRVETSDLVKTIIDLAHQVVSEAKRDFKQCHDTLQLISDDNYRSQQVNALLELLALRKRNPTTALNDLQRILRQMTRCEFRRKHPALYDALQRALTVPFLPPTGPRSALQLREGARCAAAAGLSGDDVEATVLVAAGLLDGVQGSRP